MSQSHPVVALAFDDGTILDTWSDREFGPQQRDIETRGAGAIFQLIWVVNSE